MEERDITMADMIMKIIQGNQLTAGEEDAVGELLLHRQAERDESRDCRCLAEYVDAAIKRTLRRQGKEAWEKYSYFNKRYVKESRVGNLDAAGLTAADIRRLVVLTAGTYRMGSEDRLFFLSMLQYALNLMEKKRCLKLCRARAVQGMCEGRGQDNIYRKPIYRGRNKEDHGVD